MFDDTRSRGFFENWLIIGFGGSKSRKFKLSLVIIWPVLISNCKGDLQWPLSFYRLLLYLMFKSLKLWSEISGMHLNLSLCLIFSHWWDLCCLAVSARDAFCWLPNAAEEFPIPLKWFHINVILVYTIRNHNHSIKKSIFDSRFYLIPLAFWRLASRGHWGFQFDDRVEVRWYFFQKWWSLTKEGEVLQWILDFWVLRRCLGWVCWSCIWSHTWVLADFNWGTLDFGGIWWF